MKLLYFTATWCVPCRTFGPIMDDLKTHIPVIKVDVDEHPDATTAHSVMSVPTVILLNGDEEVGRFSGARDRNFVDRFIMSHIT